MKNEAQLCTVIVNSLDWGHKISDSGGITHGLLPHDIYGIYNGHPTYIEAKFLKTPASFNWNRLEIHQLESLEAIKQLCPDSLCWILIGVVFGRGDIRVFKFDDLEEVRHRKENKLNVLKKEMLTLPYFKMKKGRIDFEHLYYD